MKASHYLLVEQNAKISLRLADYGYVLDAGKIVLEGDGAALRDDDRIMTISIGD